MIQSTDEGHAALTTTRYGEFRSFPMDSPVGQSLITYGEWAENELRVLCPLIRPRSTVIDVGAYVGTHSVAFSHQVGTEGLVVAIEPNPTAFSLLADNLERNARSNYVALNAAMNDRSGQALYLHSDPGNIGATRLAHEAGENGAAEAVESVITLDGLDVVDCTLVKVDVEGMSSNVLLGARRLLERERPILAVEVNDAQEARNAHKAVEGLHNFTYLLATRAFNPYNFRECDRNEFGLAMESMLVFSDQALDECAGQRMGVSVLVRIEDPSDIEGLINEVPRYGDGHPGAANVELLQQRIADLTEMNQELALRSSLLELRLDALSKEFQVALAEHEAEEAPLRDVLSQYESTRDQLAAIESSRIWRATSFYRRLRRGL